MQKKNADANTFLDGINADWNSLLSGAIAGLVILLLNILYGRGMDWWNRRQERKALLRIIDAEVYENNRVLQQMITDPDLSELFPSRAALTVDAWEQSRVRLAQLLSQDHIKSLVAHYASISRIRASLSDVDASIRTKTRQQKDKATKLTEKRRVLVSSLARVAWLEGEEIRKKGKRYIGTLPDYFGTGEREAEEAATRDQGEDNGEDADTEEAGPK